MKAEREIGTKVTLTHRNIFILPSKSGLGFAGLILLLLLIAFVYNNNLAYQLTFLLASIFFITILHSYQSLSALLISQKNSEPVFAGEAMAVEIIVNNSSKVERLNLVAELESTSRFSVAADQKKQVILYAQTFKRGWNEFGKVTLSSTYPLGLFRAWSPLPFVLKALVYPKPSRVELPFPSAEDRQVQMNPKRSLNKGNDDFYGLKEYQQGDSIKQIHWKAFAKGQGLLSKEYSEDNQIECWFDFESAPGQHIEGKLSQLCRWIVDAEKAGLKYGLSLPNFKLEPSLGETHYKQCLEALALF